MTGTTITATVLRLDIEQGIVARVKLDDGSERTLYWNGDRHKEARVFEQLSAYKTKRGIFTLYGNDIAGIKDA